MNTPPFSVLPAMSRRFDHVGRTMAFDAASAAELQRWRRALVRKLKSLTGYDTMVPTPLRPKITEQIRCDGYVRQRVEIQTEPHVRMPLYVLLPESGQRFAPVIAPHGHASGGKLAVAGIRTRRAIAKTIREHNYDYGVQLVREGFAVFCPDARGFGERQEFPSNVDILNSSCQWINHMAYPLGQTVTGMWTWDLHRLIDYIETRPDCDAKRLGCAGLSGGGLQTLWATALDRRIRCAVISGYFYGYKQSLLEQYTNCSCNFVPNLYEHVDMGDIGALIAPRPLMIETGDEDNLNGRDNHRNVKSHFPITRRAYRLCDATGALKHRVFHGPHRWHGVEAIPWLKRWLQQRAASPSR